MVLQIICTQIKENLEVIYLTENQFLDYPEDEEDEDFQVSEKIKNQD